MTRFFDRRVVILSGKGGTGKSTMAAALAMAAARKGRRVLVTELNVREKVPALFGAGTVGYEPQQVWDGVEACNLVPQDCLREYGLMKLKLKRLYRLVFENEVMRRITTMLPGLNELLLLGKLMNLEQETVDRRRRPRWDLIVVDAPATGHGVALLRLPQVILDMIPSGPMAEDARAIRDLLQDAERTCLNIVSLPEEMAVVEAAELEAKRREVLGIAPGFLFVNSVWPRFLADHERAILCTYHNARRGDEPELEGVVQAICECSGRREHQQPHLARARSLVDLPLVEVPYVFSEEFGPAEIETISENLTSAIAAFEGT